MKFKKPWDAITGLLLIGVVVVNFYKLQTLADVPEWAHPFSNMIMAWVTVSFIFFIWLKNE